jgi:hypothetical protein
MSQLDKKSWATISLMGLLAEESGKLGRKKNAA